MQPSTTERGGQHNRERILHAAIDLMAARGYGSVTTREIAAAVGIKAASIYNHFPSKEAILDEIVAMLAKSLHERVHPAFNAAQPLDLPAFLQGITQTNDAFFSDPLHGRVGTILMREQFQNERIRLMLLDEMIEAPRRMIAAFFARLMDAGKMRAAEPSFAAREYHAFFIYEFYATALAFGLRAPDMEAVAQREAHVRQFLATWAR